MELTGSGSGGHSSLPLLAGRALQAPGHLRRPPRQTLGPTLPLTRAQTSVRPSARCTAGGSGLPAFWGLTLTLGRHPRGPSQGPGAATLGIGDPRAPLLDSHCRPPPPGPLGAPPVIQGGRTGRASEPPATFEGPPPRAKMLGPTLLLSRALTSARPSARCTAGGSGLPASWGLTLTLGRPSRGPSEGAWRRNDGHWEPPKPSAGLTLPPSRHPDARGAAGHSGPENGQGPLSAW